MTIKPNPTPPNTVKNANSPCDSTTQGCPLCDATVTIGRVRRGNPYVSRNVTTGGMPDSVPPTKTYEVEVKVTWSKPSCPGQQIDLSIINGSADNGTATISPTSITTTSTVTVTGGNQTSPGHGGNLKIQAKLDGSVKAESSGFTVCAHPVNYTDSFVADIDEPGRVGMIVQDGWDSDSGTFADLGEAEISEIVEYDAPISPPYAGGGGANNSLYLRADQLSTDTHTIAPRPAAGPAASWERRQVCIFKCHRCGATDKDHPNSGFKIVHYVFSDSGHWKHNMKKIGAKVTARGHTSEGGTANAVSPDHNLS